MTIFELKGLVLNRRREEIDEELLQFMIGNIHYDFSIFQELFGNYFIEYPEFFHFSEIQKMAMLFNSLSNAISKFPKNNIKTEMYLKFFQEHKKEEVCKYFQEQYQIISKFFKDNFEKNNHFSKNDFSSDVGPVLYFHISSFFNIFLSPYYMKIFHLLDRDYPCRNEFLVALAHVNDPNVLKCIYNCLILASDRYLLGEVYDIDSMPSFLKNRFSLFHQVLFKATENLNCSNDYNWLLTMYQEFLDINSDQESIKCFQEISAVLKDNPSDIRSLKDISCYIKGYDSLYLFTDQLCNLGNANHFVENTVDFLKFDHYKRDRSLK